LKRNDSRSFLAQAQVNIARWHAMLAVPNKHNSSSLVLRFNQFERI
jgi:hypothetical protein